MVTVMFDLLMANADVFAWGYNAFVKAQEEVRMHLVAHNPRQGCSPVAAAEQHTRPVPGCGPSASATALLHVWAVAIVRRQQQPALCEALPSCSMTSLARWCPCVAQGSGAPRSLCHATTAASRRDRDTIITHPLLASGVSGSTAPSEDSVMGPCCLLGSCPSLLSRRGSITDSLSCKGSRRSPASEDSLDREGPKRLSSCLLSPQAARSEGCSVRGRPGRWRPWG